MVMRINIIRITTQFCSNLDEVMADEEIPADDSRVRRHHRDWQHAAFHGRSGGGEVTEFERHF